MAEKAPVSPVPVAVQLVDKLGEIVGILALAWLCSKGKLGGELTAGAILLVLGVQQGLRSFGAARTGAVGLAILTAGPAAVTTARALAAFLTPLAAVLFFALASSVAGCGPTASEAATRLAPGVPEPGECSPLGATRCHGLEAQVCSARGRWWTQFECSQGCEATNAGARCAARDAGVGQ